jgi:hypothetical protein
MTTTTEHPFARFGTGPYVFVGLQTIEDREALNRASESAGLPYTTNMCGGSCELCGTAIWNVFTFETSCGKRFKVGCECATKAGEGNQVKDGIKARKREIRDESERANREERLEAQRVANGLLGHGRVTNEELVLLIEAQRKAAIQALREASRHFGTVGERVRNVELRYEGHYAVENMAMGGWIVLLFLRRVDTGAAIVWKTTRLLPNRKAGTEIGKGETFQATFTVKGYGHYRGNHPTTEAQTLVQRLEVL